MIRQTKFKLTVFAVILSLVEAALKLQFKDFPLAELFTFQASIITAYLASKAFVDKQEIKFNNKSSDERRE